MSLKKESTEVRRVKELFFEKYPYVNIWDVSDEDVMKQWNKPYMRKEELDQQLYLLYDYILANDLTDVEE